MKANILSIFLLSFFIFSSTNSENENIVNIASDIAQKNVEPNLAAKGALIEAIFILQNQKNKLARHLRKVKSTLVEIDHLIKDLVHEREMLFDHFYSKGMQSNKNNIIDSILADLSVFYGEILYINLIKGIYPNYLKQLQLFLDDINTNIDQFVGGKKSITFSDLKTQVDKFDNLLDAIEKEQELLKFVLDAETLKLNCKKYKEKIHSRHRQLAVFEHNAKNKEDQFFVEQKELINRAIKKLKNSMAKLINNLAIKQERIKSLKQNLIQHYEEHQKYSCVKLCPQEEASSAEVTFKSVKPQSLWWYIENLEVICKRLNKNFNLEDLV